MPRTARWLLATLLPTWIVCFSLHVYSTAENGAALSPFFATPVAGDAYPHVGGIRPERVSRGLDIQAGDRLLMARDVDLAGVGYIGFYAWTVELADENLELPLTIERDGRRFTTLLRLSTTGIPWSRVALWAFGVGLAVLVLVRVPENRMAQLLFAGLTSFAIFESPFTINYTLTVIYNSIFVFGGGLSLAVLMRFFLLFPDDMPPERRLPMSLSWINALLFYAPRFSYLAGGPIPPPSVPLVILGSDIALGVLSGGAVFWNYVYSGPDGRRRLRGLLWGVFIAFSPLPVALGLSLLFPEMDLIRFGIDVMAFTAISLPIAIAFSIVRHDAFDIDRLISATATFSVALAILLGGLLAVAPIAASVLAEWTGLSRDTAQLAFALVASLALLPMTRSLRPRVDRLLYPDRHAMDQGFQELLTELAQHGETETLISLAAARIQQLLQPETTVLYARGPDGFEPVYTSRGEPPTAVPSSSPALIAVDARQGPMMRSDASLRPLEGAALDELGAATVLPFYHRDDLDAFAALGPLASGDPYSSSQLALLSATADKVEGERVRREDAVQIRESGERMRSLEREREEVQAAYAARSRSLAAASHDLRQPLHAMGLLAEAAAGRELDEGTRALVERLQMATGSLGGMFDSLLDLSQLEAGQVEPAIQPVALAPLFERLGAAVGPSAQEKGLSLNFSQAGWAVQSDPLWLARILQNLLANAIRYTESGHVSVSAEATGESVEISVTDTGPGIPAEQQRVIFEEFRRLEGGEQADERGLGLGLAIVDRLTRLLDHELSLESELGEGTTFRLRILRAADPVRAEHGQIEAVSGLAGLRVLLIDDQSAIREGMTSLLEGWGCRVQATACEEEAQQAIAQTAEHGPPDLVIADVRLAAGRSGLDALAAIRERWGSGIPGLVITGESDANTLRRLREEGHPILTKPVPPARLRAFLQRIARQESSPESD